MTGRRKGSRKSGSTSKKDTPEKTRRSSRRRGHKKSESDEPASDDSVDRKEENKETPRKIIDLNKEDESGGSDGAWQVRSENGNKGGIPKLKLSLHRPSETSSPTPEPSSSPKPRRLRRGAINEEASEDGEDSTPKDTVSEASENEGDLRGVGSRRSKSDSRSQNRHDPEHNADNQGEDAIEKTTPKDAKQRAEDKETKSKGRHSVGESVPNTNDNKDEIQNKDDKCEEKERLQNEEAGRRKAEEEIEETRLQAEKEKEEARLQAEKEIEVAQMRAKEKEQAELKAQYENENAQRKAQEEKEKTRQKVKEEKDARLKAQSEQEEVKKAQDKKDMARRKIEIEKKAQEKIGEEPHLDVFQKTDEEKSKRSRMVQISAGKSPESSCGRGSNIDDVAMESLPGQLAEDQIDVHVEHASTNIDSEEQQSAKRKRRSPSRDSSEERAKQAALASRKSKMKSGSEDGEVVDSPEREVSFPVRTEGKIRTSRTANADNGNKEVPVVRKRRWGSSNSSVAVQKPLSISTDILKEIIPEVKPVALSEVELSPRKDSAPQEDAERPQRMQGRASSLSQRRRSVPSDESEKDYEEEGVESDGEEMVKKAPPAAANHLIADVDVKESKDKVVPVVLESKTLPMDPLESLTKQRSPSPAKNPLCNVLYITNLVRPFTVVQLRDLLARTGTIAEDKGFWIDPIKSKCYVKYTTEEDAKNTRHAIHGIQWPSSNPKKLNVDYGTEEAMTAALEGKRVTTILPERQAKVEERDVAREVYDAERRRSREDKKPELGKSEKEDNSREVRRLNERERELGRDRSRGENRDRSRDEKPSRTVRKVTLPVREWDMGKERGFSPPEDSRRFPEVARKRDKERLRSHSLEPQKKHRRHEEDLTPPIKLEDLFQVTKTRPVIYWKPLSAQQIAEKETQRRKHMEEHEKRINEERKKREAKRRPSRSRSPKK